MSTRVRPAPPRTPPRPIPPTALAAVVDGTRKECKGVLALLEGTLGPLPLGSQVRALVADVPSHIDVRAWAERKGHAVLSDLRVEGHFEMVIVKGGLVRGT